MVSIALGVMRRNMKRRSIVTGAGREDRWEYPEGAIRELVVNAPMHRDYHPMAHGTRIRLSLYPDRLEIANPGGLHGPLSRDSLLVEPVSSISRNATLIKLLEDVQSIDDRRMTAENRGSGLLATTALLRRAGMDPPELADAVHQLTVTLPNHGLLDEDIDGLSFDRVNRPLNNPLAWGFGSFARACGGLVGTSFRTPIR